MEDYFKPALWLTHQMDHQILIKCKGHREEVAKERHQMTPRRKKEKQDPLPLKKHMFTMSMNKYHNISRIIAIGLGQELNNSYRIWNLDPFFVMLVRKAFGFFGFFFIFFRGKVPKDPKCVHHLRK